MSEGERTGVVPDAFKAAYITPLLKKPGLDVDVVENYRPVSNLSSLSKLLERAVFNQLESHLVDAGLFPSVSISKGPLNRDGSG